MPTMILKEQQLWKIECLKRYWLFFGRCAYDVLRSLRRQQST